MFIAGEFVDGQDVVDVRSPWDGAMVGTTTLADATLLGRALESAASARGPLAESSKQSRSRWLSAIAAEIRARRDAFASLITSEAGKPITLSRAEVDRAIITFTCAADEALKPTSLPLVADAYPLGAGYQALTDRFPIGAILGITPFNFPLNLVAHKLAPAIACGCPIIIKPSLRTPLTALLLAEVIDATDKQTLNIPGAAQVLVCRNEDTAALMRSDTIAMISFTGSDTVGWQMRRDHSRKRMTLELGGNAATMVHHDVDLEFAVRATAMGAFAFAGQSCIAVQRLFVHEDIYNDFRTRLLDSIQSGIIVGDPSLELTVVGPMIDDEALRRALGRIEAARKSGAIIVTGGSARGPCLLPTVIEEPSEDLDVVKEEMFAPVVTLHRYRDFDDAIRRANRSRFGLQAGVFTHEPRLIQKAFETLEVGAVVVNQSPTFRLDNLPYGGVKDSGIGREGVASAMVEMTEERVLLRKLKPEK
jgi:acyl-CoA reductase-like NAD-dependent aldehyde dehydrogenase